MPSPSLYLDWYDSPPDSAHSSARASIEAIWEKDEALGAPVALFPWVGDGIVEREQLLLAELASLMDQHPGLAGKVAAYPWMNTLNAVSTQAHLGVAAIQAAAVIDIELAELLADYHWLQDGITSVEANALTEITDLVRHDHATASVLASSGGFVNGGAIEHVSKGAGHLSGIFKINPALGQQVAAYPWIEDGITRIEARALAGMYELLRTSVAANPELAEAVAGHAWIADGITAVEIKALDDFRVLGEVSEDVNSGVAQRLAVHSWVADGITREELDAVNWFEELLTAAGAGNTGFVDAVAGFSWVADGVTPSEQEDLRVFWRWLHNAEGSNTVFLQKMPTYSWVDDGITQEEWLDIGQLSELEETARPENSAHVQRLMGYPWVADGLALLEMEALHVLWELLDAAAASDSGVAENLTHQWITECAVLESPKGRTGVLELLKTSPPEYSAFLEELFASPWLADGVAAEETETLHLIRDLLAPLDSVNTLMAEKLAEYPWAPGGVNEFECSALARFRSLLDDPEVELPGNPWFDDGIDDGELALLAVLHSTRQGSLLRYKDLLGSYFIQSKTVRLPLAGDIKLMTFQDKAFHANDSSIDDMAWMSGFLEEFMGVPFPRSVVVVRTIESKNYDDAEEENVGGGYSLSDQIVITDRSVTPLPDIIFHEMAHIYWGGHTGSPDWMTEGTAEFLSFHAMDTLGLLPLAERRAELTELARDVCEQEGIGAIKDLLELQENEPEKYLDKVICSYHLGELFWLETYQLFGRDAVSAAMRELYLQAEATDWTKPIAEEQIYRVLLVNAPRGKVEAFQALYQRYHGGVYGGG